MAIMPTQNAAKKARTPHQTNALGGNVWCCKTMGPVIFPIIFPVFFPWTRGF